MRKGIWAICFLCASLLCCGYSYRGDWSKVTFTVNEEYVEASNEYGVIGLPTEDGIRYVKLPCSAKLFEDAGFVLLDEVDTEFRPWTESWSSCAYDSQGRYLTLHLKNDSDTTVSVQDCNVYNVSYDATEDKEVGILNVTFGGLKPTDNQSKAYEIFGANDSKYDVGGITYTTWETGKSEYTLNMEYDSTGAITKLKSSVDESDKEYGSIWDYAYEDYEPLDGTTDPITTSNPQAKTMPLIAGLLVCAVIGVPVLLLLVVLFVLFHHRKKKIRLQEEAINLQYLNADISEDIDDSLLDKYNEKI